MLQVGRTPLYIATQRGQTAIVEMLVDKFHANVSSRSNDGSTLMHVAALCGNADTAMAMLKKGVPLNMPNKVNHIQISSYQDASVLVIISSSMHVGLQGGEMKRSVWSFYRSIYKGALKMTDMKMQNMKLTDQFAGHLQGTKLQDIKMQDMKMQDMKLAQKRQTSETE